MSGSVLKLIIFISLLFDLAVSQDPPDPCTTYTPFPDSDRRGINYTLSNGESSIDDNELTEGWYGDKRYTLVEESPGFYKCGGWYPIYIQERTNNDLTMCVQTTSDACAYNIGVEARQCSGFKVYHLPQAPVHRAVYCLAASPGAPPQFDKKPRISVELMDKEDSSELLFWCNFTRSSENLFYKTIWYVEGTPKYTFEPLEWNSDDFDYIANRTLTEQLLKDNGVEKAGFNLQCGVQALYAPGQATSSGELSEVQFVGVKIIQDNNQPLFEGETRNIPLKLTVPFGCGTRFNFLECVFDINVIRIQKQRDTGLSVVVENSCGLDTITSTQWRQGTSVSVVGKITPSYGEETATTQLKLKTPSNTGGLLSSLWTDYEIGLVTIQMAKDTTLFQSKTCSSRNDPQIRTFDSTWFYLGHSAVYTLYNASDDIVVQIQTEDCVESNVGPFCTCGVAVRAGKTVFEISHCESLTWHIGYTACGDDGDVLQVRRTYFTDYTIYLPTGNTVQVHLKDSKTYHYVNVHVTSSVNDVGKSRGICGKLSATRRDDLIKRDGSLAMSTEDFAESWRVKLKEDNLFDPEVNREGLQSYKPLLQYCTCEDEGLTCTAMAATDTVITPDGSEKIKPKNCVISKRKKRMALRTQKRSRRQVQTSEEWFNGWNETLAQAYCEDKFSESKAVQVCGDVPGVNVANSKQECVKDIQLSGTDAFVSMAVESVYTNCFREALVNPILNMSEPGKPSVFEKITEETCTQDCSKRGVCEKGQCRCNPGFGGGDCSVELSYPPTLFDVGDGGRCDLATGKCIETAVLGDIFSGEESSRCQIKKSMVKQDGQMAISSVTTSKAVTESISEVTCYLPEAFADDVTTSYNISVSNIGTFYSNELTVLVYDSTCVTVDNDTMIWSLRDGYCTHKGKCVMEGGTLEDDACVSCEIIDNQRVWKTETGGICVNRAGNVSGKRVFVMLGLLLAAAAAMNHGQ